MGVRYRKSKKVGPFRINFSKSGVGWSVGGKGFRYTKMANGRTRKTYSIPGTGISYVDESKSNKQKAIEDNYANDSHQPPKRKKKHLILKIIGVICLIEAILYLFLMLFGFIKPTEIAKVESITLAENNIVMDINEQKDISFSTNPVISDTNVMHMESNKDLYANIVGHKIEVRSGSATGNFSLKIEGVKKETTLNVSVVDQTAEKEEQRRLEEQQRAQEEAQRQAESQAAAEAQAQAEQSSQEETVYISSTGSKYHSNPNCSGMNNPTSISLEDAKSRGYTACKRCY